VTSTDDAIKAINASLYDDLMTYSQAGKALGLSQGTLRRLIKNDELRATRLGRQVYIFESSVRSYVRNFHERLESDIPVPPAQRTDSGDTWSA
jgi:excisionase family DNA binding protein